MAHFEIKDLSFSYPASKKETLSGVNLTVGKGEYIAMREMRKHIGWYTAGLPGSAAFRGRINEIEEMGQLEEVISRFMGD